MSEKSNEGPSDEPMTLNEIEETLSSPQKKRALSQKHGLGDSETSVYLDMRRSCMLAEQAKRDFEEDQLNKTLANKAMTLYKSASAGLLKERLKLEEQQQGSDEYKATKEKIKEQEERVNNLKKAVQLYPQFESTQEHPKKRHLDEEKTSKPPKLPTNAPHYKSATANAVEVLKHGDECRKMLALFPNESEVNKACLIAQTIDSATHRRIGDHSNSKSLTAALLEDNLGQDYEITLRDDLMKLIRIPEKWKAHQVREAHNTLQLASSYLGAKRFEDLYIQILPQNLHSIALAERNSDMTSRFKSVEEYARKTESKETVPKRFEQAGATMDWQLKQTASLHDQCSLHPYMRHTNAECKTQKKARETTIMNAKGPMSKSTEGANKCEHCSELNKIDPKVNPHHPTERCFRLHPELRPERQITAKAFNIEEVEEETNTCEDQYEVAEMFLNGLN
ncbi:hypothetical protein BDR26DRAFT_892940 [Obelidium mucronatum]|nr:hypothetical protein BDR26DRAFT_892940 [Obelidium mucronatum]